ncbi:MAG: DUF2062 domain-containing protein [Desulfobacterales bacterium]|nr:MAG: DUF2062 domain-containing protein [Desulfobacterales bacterium]
MRKTQSPFINSKTKLVKVQKKIRQWIKRIMQLHGDPHYVAMGMAIGFFVAVTPTIPFHTFIAVGLAFILKASKAAAAIGVWFANPLTIPIFYLASYKTGVMLLGWSIAVDVSSEPVSDPMKLGLDVIFATIVGGIIIGIVPGIAAYVITRKIISKLRVRQKSFPNKFCDNQL